MFSFLARELNGLLGNFAVNGRICQRSTGIHRVIFGIEHEKFWAVVDC
jgi:hypothetical protein